MITDDDLKALTEGPIENRTIPLSAHRMVAMAEEILRLRKKLRVLAKFAETAECFCRDAMSGRVTCLRCRTIRHCELLEGEAK